jgi:porcupine-like protein
MYFKAFSFRQSNYFVLYFSQFILFLCQINGFETISIQKNKDENLPQVLDQFKIEFPRSLVDVVTSWNISMHVWLKKCISKTLPLIFNI